MTAIYATPRTASALDTLSAGNDFAERLALQAQNMPSRRSAPSSGQQTPAPAYELYDALSALEAGQYSPQGNQTPLPGYMSPAPAYTSRITTPARSIVRERGIAAEVASGGNYASRNAAHNSRIALGAIPEGTEPAPAQNNRRHNATPPRQSVTSTLKDGAKSVGRGVWRLIKTPVVLLAGPSVIVLANTYNWMNMAKNQKH